MSKKTTLPIVGLSHPITEDDTPIDNIISERQIHLLTKSLYASWEEPSQHRSFVALSNVGFFTSINKPPIVPDVLISLDVEIPENVIVKHHHSYFLWVYGKPPNEQAIEEYKRAEWERLRADQERQPNEQLVAQLQALGVEPEG